MDGRMNNGKIWAPFGVGENCFQIEAMFPRLYICMLEGLYDILAATISVDRGL
jgi:hypothetical protein